jgi:hypothetical protein
MPHITWCLSGLLSFLPIHAAGLYGALGQPKIFHYVVSSYVPSLTVLLSVKRRSTEDTGGARLLTVCQPATPGQNLLPGTLDEINSIQTLQSRSGQFNITRLIDREATVAAVVQYMKECNWIHLACHGVQDNISPTDSAFLLIDGRLTLCGLFETTMLRLSRRSFTPILSMTLGETARERHMRCMKQWLTSGMSEARRTLLGGFRLSTSVSALPRVPFKLVQSCKTVHYAPSPREAYSSP